MHIKIHDLLAEVLRSGASDLHLGVGHLPCFRIDGELHPVAGLSTLVPEDLEQAISDILQPEQMASYRQSREYDFSFTYHSPSGEEARFRGNCFFESGNMTLALRLIPMRIRPIEELGLPRCLLEVTEQRRGLFLVTGPTGHGKTTTLAALIDEINRKRRDHVVTIEDPVEYVYKSQKSIIHQRQVGIDTRSFAACGPCRSNDTSLIASASVTLPFAFSARIARGLITSSTAASRRSGRPSMEKPFIRKPIVPQFMP